MRNLLLRIVCAPERARTLTHATPSAAMERASPTEVVARLTGVSELAQEEASSGACARCAPEPPTGDRATVATCGGSAQRLPKRCRVRNCNRLRGGDRPPRWCGV